MSCLFFGLSGTSAEGGGFERTLIPCGGIDNMMLIVVSDIGPVCLGKEIQALCVSRRKYQQNLEVKCR